MGILPISNMPGLLKITSIVLAASPARTDVGTDSSKTQWRQCLGIPFLDRAHAPQMSCGCGKPSVVRTWRLEQHQRAPNEPRKSGTVCSSLSINLTRQLHSVSATRITVNTPSSNCSITYLNLSGAVLMQELVQSPGEVAGVNMVDSRHTT